MTKTELKQYCCATKGILNTICNFTDIQWQTAHTGEDHTHLFCSSFLNSAFLSSLLSFIYRYMKLI